MVLLQLHNNDSLFLAGKNFGNKISVGQKNVTEIYFDTDDNHVHVLCEGQEAWVKGYMNANPTSGKPIVELTTAKHHPMHSGVPVKAQVGGPNEVLKQVEQGLAKRFTAQVETPQDKVQGKPGRKPKFQGQET